MKHQQRKEDILFSVCIFFSAFAINLLIRKLFTTQTLVPMIFVFGVFFDIAENARVLLWYCFGCLKRICSKFRFYLSLLYFRFFCRRKHIIRYNYAGCCRFHQYVEQ